MKLTITPTETFCKSEDGYTVRIWTGTTDTGEECWAYVAAIAVGKKGLSQAMGFKALVEIPGPRSVVDKIAWQT